MVDIDLNFSVGSLGLLHICVVLVHRRVRKRTSPRIIDRYCWASSLFLFSHDGTPQNDGVRFGSEISTFSSLFIPRFVFYFQNCHTSVIQTRNCLSVVFGVFASIARTCFITVLISQQQRHYHSELEKLPMKLRAILTLNCSSQ